MYRNSKRKQHSIKKNSVLLQDRKLFKQGIGVFANFTVTNDITHFTTADMFSHIGKKTNAFVRFSNMLNCEDDFNVKLNGLGVKFYTNDGNWDIVSTHMPMFFIKQDTCPQEFLKAINIQSDTGFIDHTKFWGFMGDYPETLACLTSIFAEDKNKNEYFHKNFYSQNTYIFTNADGMKFYGRIIFNSLQKEIKLKNQTTNNNLNLFNNLEKCKPVEWQMCIQLIPQDHKFLNDATKAVDSKQYPYIPVGVLTIECLPASFEKTTQVAYFDPLSTVKGIAIKSGYNTAYHSKMIAQRIDDKLYKVNKGRISASKNIVPSRLSSKECKQKGKEWDNECIKDILYAGKIYDACSQEIKNQIINSTAASLKKANKNTQYRYVTNCYMASKHYGLSLCLVLNLRVARIVSLSKLNYINRKRATS